MNRMIVPAVALAAATLTGVAIGGTMLGTASAATVSPSSTSPTTGTTGKWHSNTDPTHEAGEGAARKAEEARADATGVARPEMAPDTTSGTSAS